MTHKDKYFSLYFTPDLPNFQLNQKSRGATAPLAPCFLRLQCFLLSLSTFGFFMKFALFCSQKTTERVKFKFGMQVRKPFLILCTKFET